MSKQTINIGVSPNDNTGTPLRDAFDMINDNFNEIYALNGGSAAFPSLGTSEQVLRVNSGGTALEFFDLNSALSAYLPLTGGTLTGALDINVVGGANNITSTGAFTLASHNAITDIYSYSNGKITTDINADTTEISTDVVIPSNKLLQFSNSNVRINTDTSNRMYLRALNSFYFETNGYQGRWSTTGLGVGTTSPSYQLDVQKSTNGPVARIWNTSSSTGGNGLSVSGGLSTEPILTLGNYLQQEKFRFTAEGRLGIGTNAPNRDLHIKNTGYPFIELQSGGYYPGYEIQFTKLTSGLEGHIKLYRNPGMDSFQFQKYHNGSPNSRLELKPNQVDLFTSSSYQSGLLATSTTTSIYSNYSIAIRTNASGYVGIKNTNPTEALDVTGNGLFSGNLTCVALTQTSERDSKKDIFEIDKRKAKSIPFKEYKYKSSIDRSERKRYGVIVEDIEEFYPELVYTTSSGAKSVNYIDLLVKRVAELEKELEDTNNRFNNIESISFEKDNLKIVVEGKEFFFRQA